MACRRHAGAEGRPHGSDHAHSEARTAEPSILDTTLGGNQSADVFSLKAPLAVIARVAGTGAGLGALVATVDAAAGGGPAWLSGMAHGVGLGAGVGAMVGIACGMFLVLPARLAAPLGMLLGFGAGHLLADALGAYARLHGHHRVLGWLALVGAFVGGSALGLTPLAARRRSLVAALALAAGAVVLLFADRALFVGLYPVAHTALRTAAFSLALLALATHAPSLSARGRAVGAGLVVLLAALPLVLLDERSPSLPTLVARPWVGLALQAERTLLDFDGDGYASLLGGGDCAPFDPKISPGATEIPGNGIDDNCLLGDAPTEREATREVPPPTVPSPVDVVLITLDATRPDHTGMYGYRRDTTPNLTRWASHALRFEHAYSAGAWTSISVSSMLRGVYPRRIQWTRLYETDAFRLLRGPPVPQLRPGERIRLMFGLPIDDPRPTLAEWLHRRGMTTAAVVDGGYSQFLSAKFGMAAGFDRFVDEFPGGVHGDDTVADEAIRTIAALPSDRPFFLWVHFFGPHDVGDRHPEVPDYGAGNDNEYDHAIAFADLQAGRVLEALRARPSSRPLAIMVSSDHGEHVEPARYHGTDLYECSIRVPLLIEAPGFAAGRSDRLVSLVDVMPTVLGLTGTPPPPGLDGMDLALPDRPRALIAENWRYEGFGSVQLDQLAAFDGTRKLVIDRTAHVKRLERQDVLDQPPALPVPEGDPAVDRLVGTALRHLEMTRGNPHMAD